MMPKGRYRIMTAYMPKVGKHGLDYSSEADMVKKLRLSLALQPVATAMFANSPFTEGKPNGFSRSAPRSGAIRMPTAVAGVRAWYGLRALRRLCPRTS
jgi:glutamate--cysteine ligase